MTKYKLVPVEPTPKMIEAGAKEVDWYQHNALACFTAMLAAAPEPVQKPVAYMHISGEDCVSHPDLERNPAWTGHYPIPLYTTPPSTTALLRQALDALEGLFGIPDALTGAGAGGVAVWRLGGSHAPHTTIEAIKSHFGESK